MLFLCALNAADAADIDVKQLENGSALVVVEGELTLDDVEKFRTNIAALPSGRATVEFQSKGGRLLAGIRIGTLIRNKKFITVVPDEAQCASACALAWLGGSRRYVGRDSSVGFHAAFVHKGAGPAESATGNAIVGAYLNQIGLSEKAILYITRGAPMSMQWMRLEEAAEYEIAVAPLPPPDSAPRSNSSGVVVTEHREGSPERRAIDFVRSLVARWSGPNAGILPSLGGLYAEKVVYDGKTLPRQTVLLNKRRFADRWSQRSYYMRPGSLSATCTQDGGICRVKGITNWKFHNAKMASSSRGVTSFEYSVVLEGAALQIAAETSSTSSVNEKKPTAPPSALSKVGRNIQKLFARLSKPRPATPPVRTAVRSKTPIVR